MHTYLCLFSSFLLTLAIPNQNCGVPPGPMAEGKNYSLSCHTEISIPNVGNVTVEWFIGQDRLNTETINSTMEAINATYSFLYTPLIAHNGAQYQCVVQFQPPGETSPLQNRSNALNIYVYSKFNLYTMHL